MKVFALSDPHLSFGTPGKEMDRFGEGWVRHADTIAEHWRQSVAAEDLVLVPGDISWAMRLEGARPDLEFLGGLPGTKVLVKGNHDYWWNSLSKVRAALPDTVHALQGDAVRLKDVVLAGTRLWDVPGLSFQDIIDWVPSDSGSISAARTLEDEEQSQKIYRREVARLERSLAELERQGTGARLKIALTHYPPVGPRREPSELTALFERAGVEHVVFGHLHSVRRDLPEALFGRLNGVTYHLASCDFLDFRPTLIAELPGY